MRVAGIALFGSALADDTLRWGKHPTDARRGQEESILPSEYSTSENVLLVLPDASLFLLMDVGASRTQTKCQCQHDPENTINHVDHLKASLFKYAEITTGVVPVCPTTPPACVASSWFDTTCWLFGGRQDNILVVFLYLSGDAYRRASLSPYIIMSVANL